MSRFAYLLPFGLAIAMAGCKTRLDAAEGEGEGEGEGEVESEGESESEGEGAPCPGVCDDADPCTLDTCNGATGECEYPASGGTSSDSPELAITDFYAPSFDTDSMEVSAPDTTFDALFVTLVIDHTYVGDLVITITHEETATMATLLDRPGEGGNGNNGGNFNGTYSFRDGAMAFPSLEVSSGVVAHGAYAPSTSLADFAAESPVGTWTIAVSDSAGQDIGVLHTWTLFFGVACDDMESCSAADYCVDSTCEGLVSDYACCGDGSCELGESGVACWADCPCGDGYCDYANELGTCADDCGTCTADTCGSFGTTQACYCDADCVVEGDCCGNACKLCGYCPTT